MKRTICCCILIASTALPSLAKERIVNGDFKGASDGSFPAKPWSVSSQVKEATDVKVTVAPLPGGEADKKWVRILDNDPEVPAGMLQNFDTIKSGRFSMKLHFAKVGSAFGIYLGAPKVSGPDTRTIDMKILKNGTLSTGKGEEREKHDFKFTEGTTYDLYIDFKTSDDGTKITYELGLEGGEVLVKDEVSADIPIAGLRITTDSLDDTTDVYVTDVSLASAD